MSKFLTICLSLACLHACIGGLTYVPSVPDTHEAPSDPQIISGKPLRIIRESTGVPVILENGTDSAALLGNGIVLFETGMIEVTHRNCVLYLTTAYLIPMSQSYFGGQYLVTGYSGMLYTLYTEPHCPVPITSRREVHDHREIILESEGGRTFFIVTTKECMIQLIPSIEGDLSDETKMLRYSIIGCSIVVPHD